MENKEAVKTKISDLVAANGEVISVDDWKTKKLAYEIKHETEGVYFLYTFFSSINCIIPPLPINPQVMFFFLYHQVPHNNH